MFFPIHPDKIYDFLRLLLYAVLFMLVAGFNTHTEQVTFLRKQKLNHSVVSDAHLDFPLLDSFGVFAALAGLYPCLRFRAVLKRHVRKRAFTDGVDIGFCVRCSVRRRGWLHKEVIPNPRYYKHPTKPKNSFHTFLLYHLRRTDPLTTYKNTKAPLSGRFCVLFRVLFPADVVQVVVLATEEFLCEFCDDVRIVVLAREYVQVHGVRLVREVSRDKRGFNELSHRIPCYSLVFAEIDDYALTETFHFDEITQLDHKLLNLIRRADSVGIASVDVNRRV